MSTPRCLLGSKAPALRIPYKIQGIDASVPGGLEGDSVLQVVFPATTSG